jgi:hypothetical protein
MTSGMRTTARLLLLILAAPTLMSGLHWNRPGKATVGVVAAAERPVLAEPAGGDSSQSARGEEAEEGRRPAHAAGQSAASDGRERFVTETLRGRVVWMAEALERRFGIQSVPEAAERLLALETAAGELHPLVEDIRGRAFRRDRRLRELPECEIYVRRFHGSPMIQVIRLYAVEGDQRFELDYWCEICAITMFELKACDCCQGEIELRRRLAR